jgi:hypothetical protein
MTTRVTMSMTSEVSAYASAAGPIRRASAISSTSAPRSTSSVRLKRTQLLPMLAFASRSAYCSAR